MSPDILHKKADWAVIEVTLILVMIGILAGLVMPTYVTYITKNKGPETTTFLEIFSEYISPDWSGFRKLFLPTTTKTGADKDKRVLTPDVDHLEIRSIGKSSSAIVKKDIPSKNK